ncbi:hypothetical protein AWB77_04782 [Caballeronia fortuita]|uniref:Uncharacterized protein n=1 Tax=Caballeronia fortuita TaxID=1777138 RepID=A0A158D3L5_9BURK|nr:hypothetical protein AWB77_04782 [Caballeronia fortuita]
MKKGTAKVPYEYSLQELLRRQQFGNQFVSFPLVLVRSDHAEICQYVQSTNRFPTKRHNMIDMVFNSRLFRDATRLCVKGNDFIPLRPKGRRFKFRRLALHYMKDLQCPALVLVLFNAIPVGFPPFPIFC